MFRSRPALVLLAVLLLAGLRVTLRAAPVEPLLNKPAPAFARADLKHQRIDLAAYKGHVVLLTFWATWCAPCQIEIPHFVDWQSRYAARGLQIIAISMDDDSTPVQALARKRNINYPVLMGDEKIGQLYGGILGLPVTLLIDRQGIVRAVFRGESSLDAMHRALLKLLASQ